MQWFNELIRAHQWTPMEVYAVIAVCLIVAGLGAASLLAQLAPRDIGAPTDDDACACDHCGPLRAFDEDEPVGEWANTPGDGWRPPAALSLRAARSQRTPALRRREAVAAVSELRPRESRLGSPVVRLVLDPWGTRAADVYPLGDQADAHDRLTNHPQHVYAKGRS